MSHFQGLKYASQESVVVQLGCLRRLHHCVGGHYLRTQGPLNPAVFAISRLLQSTIKSL